MPSSVSSIEGYAFAECSSLESISIPSGVTIVNQYTFSECSSLVSVDIPSSVVSIDRYAFKGCSNLASVIIPSAVANIGSYAFGGCSSLTSLTIPSSVTSIEKYAFSDCGSLMSVFFENGITKIESNVFNKCKSLTTINIPESLECIEKDAFNSTNLNILIISNIASWCTIKRSYDSFPENQKLNIYSEEGSEITKLIIPENVTEINDYVFYNCSGITSVNIPNSVKTIGQSAFRGCSSLTTVTIPQSVTQIGGFAFSYCSSLICIAIPSTISYFDKEGIFNSCELLKDVFCFAENVPKMLSNSIFVSSYIEYATLHVPEESVIDYKNAPVWSKFLKIVPISNEEFINFYGNVDDKLKYKADVNGDGNVDISDIVCVINVIANVTK